MLEFDDVTALPLLYHLNSEPWLNLDAYAATSAEVPFPQRVGPESLQLPKSDEPDGISRVIRRRHSCRDFEAKSMPLETAAALFAFAYGTFDLVGLPDGHVALTRPVPSAGGLYPLQLYAIVLHIEGCADGVFRYEPLHHRLEPVARAPRVEEASELLLAQPFISNANLVIFVAAQFQRTLAKYGPRGYRYVLLEAGHVAQNLCLLAEERGLATLCIGGFRDAKVNGWLGIDGMREAVVYGVAVGYSASVTG